MKGKFFTVASMIAISILTISVVTGISSSTVYAAGEGIYIPVWIKKLANLRANGEIDDSDFSKVIQYLLAQKIMIIPTETNAGFSSYSEIPPWIKIAAKLWANGKLGDSTFIQGIKFLIQTGFIKLPETQQQNQAFGIPGTAEVWFAPSLTVKTLSL